MQKYKLIYNPTTRTFRDYSVSSNLKRMRQVWV